MIDLERANSLEGVIPKSFLLVCVCGVIFLAFLAVYVVLAPLFSVLSVVFVFGIVYGYLKGDLSVDDLKLAFFLTFMSSKESDFMDFEEFIVWWVMLFVLLTVLSFGVTFWLFF